MHTGTSRAQGRQELEDKLDAAICRHACHLFSVLLHLLTLHQPSTSVSGPHLGQEARGALFQETSRMTSCSLSSNDVSFS